VYFALGAAGLTYLITQNIRSTISVVIVAGACGIAAGTPLAVLGAIGRAARLGAIIKGGLFLEQLGLVDTVILDKTGTLTFGEPRIQRLIPTNGAGETALLDTAATAELRSEHPLGKAIVDYARKQERRLQEPMRFGYTPGRGVEAMVNTDQVLVGNLALLRDHGIAFQPISGTTGRRYPKCMLHARARCLAPSSSLMAPVRRHALPSRPFTTWASGLSC
jgi:Cd2+/Zn2+-exporting ATPase/Cu+-exporting ATPase